MTATSAEAAEGRSTYRVYLRQAPEGSSANGGAARAAGGLSEGPFIREIIAGCLDGRMQRAVVWLEEGASFDVAGAVEAVRAALAVQGAIHDGEGRLRTPLAMGIAPAARDRADDLAARLAALARPGQILLSSDCFDAGRARIYSSPNGSSIEWRDYGGYRFDGVDEPIAVCEVGWASRRAPLAAPEARNGAASARPAGLARSAWRAGAGLTVPGQDGWTLDRMIARGGDSEAWLARHGGRPEARLFKFSCVAPANPATAGARLAWIEQGLDGSTVNGAPRHIDFDSDPITIGRDFLPGHDLEAWLADRGGVERVPLGQRLAVIGAAAEALAEAHARGVIHGNIKPSNLIVEQRRPGALSAGWVDFGLGGAFEWSDRREAPDSGGAPPAQDLGNPYLAPEVRAGARPGTPSDIYALGVLAWQLAVGDLDAPSPRDAGERLNDPALVRLIERATHADPARRFASASDVARLARSIRDPWAPAELESEIDPERAAGAGGGAGSRLLTRGLAATALAAIVALCLLVPAGLELRRRNAELEEMNQIADAQMRRANSATQRAREDISKAFGLADTMAALFTSAEDGSATTVGDVLDRGAERVRLTYADAPHLQARGLELLARADMGLGRFDRAHPLLAEAIGLRSQAAGPDDPGVRTTIHHFQDLADSLRDMGEYRAAEDFNQQLLALRRRLYGGNHTEVITSLDHLAYVLADQGRYREAEDFHRESHDIKSALYGGQSVAAAGSLQSLAVAANRRFHFDRADELWRRVLNYQELYAAGNTRWRATALTGWGRALTGLGDIEGAERALREALELRSRVLGAKHLQVADTRITLAELLGAKGDYAAGEAQYREALEVRAAALGRSHDRVGSALAGLGDLLMQKGDVSGALGAYEKYFEIAKANFERGPSDGGSRNSLSWAHVLLGRALARRGESDSAERHWITAVGLIEPALGERASAYYLDTFAQALLQLGRVEQARPVVDRLLTEGWREPRFLELCARYGFLTAQD